MDCYLEIRFRHHIHSWSACPYMGEFDFSEGSVFIVDRGTLHQVQGGVGAVDHLAKNCVFTVEVRLLCVCDEELGFVGIGPRVRHSNHAAIIELAVLVKTGARFE